jgi:pyruvate formate lyase activating enzyme
MHIEIVTNIIPGHSDDEGQLKGIATWIYENLGEDTPWHVTRFIPYLQLSHLSPTPVATLEKAQRIGREAGLKFVYLGNVPGHKLENTYCPKCGKLLIRRLNYSILEYHIKNGKCIYCQEPIPIIEEN